MLSLAQEVTKTIIERGELSKADILRLWSINEERYAELQTELATIKVLCPGRRGQGGYRARYPKSPKRSDESRPVPAFEHDWQNDGVTRLTELLNHASLEALLGDLVYTVRRARHQMTGEDRRGNKRELATALIIAHGVDLLRNSKIRKAIGKACKLKPPTRWYPGKSRATEFTVASRFPPEYAGIPSSDTPPDFELIEGRFTLSPLQDFQEEVQAGLRNVIAQPNGRAIVTLPTGAGKTRVGVDTIRDWLSDWERDNPDTGRVVLWLAHTEELCEQAFTCFKQVWEGSNDVCSLMLFRFWGRFTQDLIDHRANLSTMHHRPTVLISTPNRMVGLVNDRVPLAETVLNDILDLTCLIVVDEAHRAATDMYQLIIDAFKSAENSASLVGLTATPFSCGVRST